jgi:hypothetical protein
MMSVRHNYRRAKDTIEEPMTMVDKIYQYLKTRFLIIACGGILAIIIYRTTTYKRKETSTTIPLMEFNSANCKTYLEKRYGKTFTSARPAWLVDDITGERMELELFNEELGIACCYHDVSHYEFPSSGITDIKDFRALVYKDALKKKMCSENGVKLIVVPYTVKYEMIPNYVMERLR